MRAALAGAAIGAAVGYLAYLAIRDGQQPAPGTQPGPGPVGPLPQACPPGGTRALLIGDSFAEGLGPQLKKLAAGCNTPYYFHAKRGSHATQWQQDSWIRPDIEAAQANVALVSLGGNDFQGNPSALEPAIAKIVDKLRSSGARVLWISPLTLPFEDTAGVREMWKRAVGAGNWFDSEHLELPRAADNIHAYPAGYRAWAEQIWPWMSGLLHSQIYV